MNRTVEVTRHYQDGVTKKSKATLHAGGKPPAQPWFEVDGDWYLFPPSTQKGTEVLYRPAPSRHTYHRMTVVAQ